MRRWFKYDVAISVAEEEKYVAKQIVEHLKKKKICYYYYEEEVAVSWGEHLIKLTKDAYGKRARFVLVITSKTYKEKYWSNIELRIAVSSLVGRKPNILPLRLDNTVIGNVPDVVYLDWKENPEEVADILKEKVLMDTKEAFRKRLPFFIGFAILLMAVLYFYRCRLTGPLCCPPHCIEKVASKQVLIPGISLVSVDGKATQRKIDSFFISNTEVTVRQFKAFCDNLHKTFPPQPPGSDEYSPVRNITWYEAVGYCKWVKGRLPTEAEWEYAASAGLSVKYSGGNSAGKVAVYNRVKPASVGAKAPNQFGVYDMTGNVAEWCDDWYDSSFLWKAVRGGAYNSKVNPVNELHVAYRAKEHPDIRSPYIGFRVAWDKER